MNLISLFRSNFSEESFKSLFNQRDHLGNFPLNYALLSLSEYKQISDDYTSFITSMAELTNLEVFYQSLTRNEASLVYKNLNFDKPSLQVKKKLIKNYVSHPSLCLTELSYPNHIVYMINFLKERNLLNFFVLHKIYELSVLDMILMKNFSQSELQSSNLYEIIYNHLNGQFQKYSVYDGSYLYYCHVDSMINLILRCSNIESKVEKVIELLTSLKKENFGQYLRFKIKKRMNLVRSNKQLIFTNQQVKGNASSDQVFTKNYIRKLKEKYLENLDSNYYVTLNTLVNNLDKLNSDSQVLLKDNKYFIA